MLGRLPPAPFDVALLEGREAAAAVLTHRFDEREMRAARGPPRSWTRFAYSRQLRHVGHEIDAEEPAGASTRATDSSVAVRSRSRSSDCRMPYGASTIENVAVPNGSARMSPRTSGSVAAGRVRARERVAPARRARASIGADDRCRRARRRRARAAARSAGAAPELEDAAAVLASDDRARTARRAGRASARSPSRRTARTRPSRPALSRVMASVGPA